MPRTRQLDWEKQADSDFEKYWNYDDLPEGFKKLIPDEDKWKSTEHSEIQKELAGLTLNKEYRYYVNEWKNQMTVSRLPPKETGGDGGGGGKKFPTIVILDFQEGDTDYVANRFSENSQRKNKTDPLWRHVSSHVLRDERGVDRLVHVIQKAVKEW